MKYLLAILAAIGIAGCAITPKVQAPGTFMADNEFVIEIEHDNLGKPVKFSPYGPVPDGQSCEQYQGLVGAQAHKFNPKGFESQTTCLHVKFAGPLGARGAVIVQPASGETLGWALIAVAYSRQGHYIGAERLHIADTPTTCQYQGQDIIDSNVKDGKIHPGWSVLIYCVPIPPIPSVL